MQHPFAGIIASEASDSRPEPSDRPAGTPRRTVLQQMLVAAGAVALLPGFARRAWGADPREEVTAEELDKLTTHCLYFVESDPKNLLSAARRKEMGIQGPLVQKREGQGKLKGKTGFFAWLSAREAAAVGEAEDVKSVAVVEPGDKAGPEPARRPMRQIAVELAPNGWEAEADEKTFETAEKVAEQLQEQLKKTAKVVALGGGNLSVNIADAATREAVIKTLKEHPQVYRLEWQAVATTLALGEEGGPGRVTTEAVGEEGGPPRATTLALGEEGNRPRITTKAIGEEGGAPPKRITTFALGEEG